MVSQSSQNTISLLVSHICDKSPGVIPDDVSPAEAIESSGQEGVSLDRLHELMLELGMPNSLNSYMLEADGCLGERTRALEQENRKLAESLNYLMDNSSSTKAREACRNPSTSGLAADVSFRTLKPR